MLVSANTETLHGKVDETHVHMCLLFFRLPSCSGHHRAQGRVPCAMQCEPIHRLLYTRDQQCAHVLPISCSLPPPVTTCPFSTSVSLFLLYKQVDLHHFSRFHIEATPFTDFKSRNLSLGMINICQPLNSSSHWLLLCHPANPPGATP